MGDMILKVGPMGFARKRVGKDGKYRYAAVYKDGRGEQRSAGSFSSKREADRAWQRAETRLAEGRLGDPRRGRISFESYVNEVWFPNHMVEPSTRQSYRYSIDKHILPEFGPMRVVEVMPANVRVWVAALQRGGVTPATIRHLKTILSAIFTTALNDQIAQLHPCRGVKTPTVPARAYRIVTPDHFRQLYMALPGEEVRLMIETDIESGLRWGELTELRPKDLDFHTRLLTVSRSVVELDPKFHPDGERFLVKAYPKGKLPRRFKLSQQIIDKLREHVTQRRLSVDDLLFKMPTLPPPIIVVQNPEAASLTAPDARGRQYRHGSTSAYTAGRCRCSECRGAFARYRAQRRAEGKDQPRQPRALDTDGHIPRNWFRNTVWRPAVLAAGLDLPLRVHDLRHAHASWLLAGGADLQVVKERLGHRSIATTEKYLHTLPDADETALAALELIRFQTG